MLAIIQFKIKEDEVGGTCSCRGGGERCLQGPLGRPRRRWEVNIKMDLREIGINGTNCIRLAQDRVQWLGFVNTVMNLRFP
jgi:hypothetical protein